MPEEVAKIVIAAAKTVAVYLILEVLTAGLIAAAFSIPLVKLSLPFALFLLPGIVVVPLVLNALDIFTDRRLVRYCLPLLFPSFACSSQSPQSIPRPGWAGGPTTLRKMYFSSPFSDVHSWQVPDIG
jgi:hypothetical protein